VGFAIVNSSKDKIISLSLAKQHNIEKENEITCVPSESHFFYVKYSFK
jgi:hypothetical protein